MKDVIPEGRGDAESPLRRPVVVFEVMPAERPEDGPLHRAAVDRVVRHVVAQIADQQAGSDSGMKASQAES